MTVKLILTDIDGTILPYGSSVVSDRTIAAFHAAIDAGVVTGPSSGRFHSWIPAFFGGDEACCATAITANGLQVYHEGEMVLERGIDPEALRCAAAVLREVPGTGLIVFRDGTPRLVQGSRDDLAVAFPRYARECLDGDGVPDAPIAKANIFVRGSMDETRRLVALLNDEVDGLDFDVPQPMFSNVMPSGWTEVAQEYDKRIASCCLRLIKRLEGIFLVLDYGRCLKHLDADLRAGRAFGRRLRGPAGGSLGGPLAHRGMRGRRGRPGDRGPCGGRVAV